MKNFVLILIILTSTVFAREHVSLTHYGTGGGNQSYYSCDYAESQAESFLELFGAKKLEVYCSGGIQSWGMAQPVSIRASFDLPEISTEVAESEVIEGDHSSPSCGLNVQMINAFVKMFPNVQVVKKSDACPLTRSNYYYLLNITR